MEGIPTLFKKAWQVLKASLLFPILGKVFLRDFSFLKPVLVEGKWDRVRARVAPLRGERNDSFFREF